jgi:hypothetical protein
MPRPERVRLREKEAAGDVVEQDPPVNEEPVREPLNRKEEVALRRNLRTEPPAAETVDNQQDAVQPVRTGQVADGDLELEVSRRVARRMGWLDKEAWVAAGRNADTHVDAPDFLEFTPKRLETLQERQKRWGQVAEEQAEQARREALAQARAEHEAAVRTGDVEAAGRAADKMVQAKGPPPQTVAWIGRNPWFRTGPDALEDEATAVTVAAIKRAEKSGASIEEQLQAGEAAAKRRFPELFDDVPQARREDPRPEPRQERQEVRLSEVRPPAPQVAGGSRGGNGPVAKKEKGWMDIPSVERAQMTRFVRSAQRKGISAEEAQNRMARTYWEDKA